MTKQKRTYAPRFDKDKDARLQVALMRLAGIPAPRIAVLTGRKAVTIEKEFRRTAHQNILLKYMKSICRIAPISDDVKGVIESEMLKKIEA